MNTYIMGQGLAPGDTIAIVAPSAPLAGEELQKSRIFLETLGYHVVLGKTVTSDWGYLAGRDDMRAADINAAFKDSHIDAVICLRGGYGATRLLDLLDYDSIAAHPKLFIGFSDITALHTALHERCHMATIHGPMALTLGRKTATQYTLRQFAAGLIQPVRQGPFLLPPRTALRGLVPGFVQGTICGGNISVLTAMIGTPYELQGTGELLFLEEIGEDAYAIDRMLRQMEQSGLINRIRGIIFGEFTRCGPRSEAPFEFTVQQIIAQYAEQWNKPALMGLPVGHGRQNGWLPLGVNASIQIENNGKARFIIE